MPLKTRVGEASGSVETPKTVGSNRERTGTGGITLGSRTRGVVRGWSGSRSLQQVESAGV